MTIEEFKNIRRLTLQVQTIKRVMNSLEIDADIHANHFGDNNTGGSYRNSYVEGRIIKHFQSYDELCNEFSEKMQELSEQKNIACKIIMMIDSELQQNILIDRYINGLSWLQITDKYHYSEPPYKLHDRALKNFEEVQK